MFVKTCDHSGHGRNRASHIANEGNEPRSQNLKNGSKSNIKNVLLRQLPNRARRSKKAEDHRGA